MDGHDPFASVGAIPVDQTPVSTASPVVVTAKAPTTAPSAHDPFASVGAVPVVPVAAGAGGGGIGLTQPTPPTGITTGHGATQQVGAGLLEGAGEAANVLSDPFGNLIGKPLALGLTYAHDLLAPLWGGRSMTPEERASLLSEDQPQIGSRIAEATARAATGKPLEEIQPQSTTEAGLRTAVGAGMEATGLGLHAAAPFFATGAFGGQVGSDLASDYWKPAAETIGNLVGGIAPAATVAGLQGAGRMAGAAWTRMASPFPVGPEETLRNPTTGQPFMDVNGEPLTARGGQAALAGRRLAIAAGKPAEGAIQEVEGAPPSPIPGAPLTAGQQTGNLGLLGRERELRNLNRAPFSAQDAAAKLAQASALAGIAGPDGQVAAVEQHLLDRQYEMQRLHDLQVKKAQADAASATPAAATTPTEAGLGMAEHINQAQAVPLAQAEAAVQKANVDLTQAMQKVGGNVDDPLARQQQGATVQHALDALDDAHGVWVSSLARAIDPTGQAVAPFAGVREAAAKAFDPNSGEEAPGAREQKLYDDIAGEEGAVPLQKLLNYRSRMTTLNRALRGGLGVAPDPTAMHRVSGLIDALDTTVLGKVRETGRQPAPAPVPALAGPAEGIRPGLGANGTPGGGPAGGPQGAPNAGGGGIAPGGGGVISLFGPKLVPNLTEDILERYALMRSEHAERKSVYTGPERRPNAVGEVLRPSSIYGEFRTTASEVMPRLLSAGPRQAEDLQAFIRAVGGRTPEEAAQRWQRLAVGDDGKPDPARLQGMMEQRAAAMDSAEQFLANDMRRVAEKNGQFVPAEYEKWRSRREALMQAFPEVAQRFATAAQAAERLADARAAVETLNAAHPLARIGEPGSIPQRYWLSGDKGADAVTRYRADTGGSPEAMKLLDDYAVYDFRQRAMPNGEWKQAAADSWIASHRQALAERPALGAQLADANRAQWVVAQTMAEREKALQDYQRGAARLVLGVDPFKTVERLIASSDPQGEAQALKRLVAGNPAAEAGLRRMIADWIVAKTKETVEAGTTGEKGPSKAMFQRITEGRPATMRAIAEILGPSGVDALNRIGDYMDMASRSWNATKVQGSPGTAADTAALRRGANISFLAQFMMSEWLGRLAEEATTGGHSLLLRGLGTAGGLALNAMRAAGLEHVSELEAYGLLNPELFKLLVAKGVTDPKAPIVRRLMRRIAAVGVQSAAGSGKQEQEP